MSPNTQNTDSDEDTRELPESIEEFPTNNKPVGDRVLKDMLISLRSSLHVDMMSCMQKFTTELQAVESRVGHKIETKMGEFANTINDLANKEKAIDMEWVKAK